MAEDPTNDKPEETTEPAFTPPEDVAEAELSAGMIDSSKQDIKSPERRTKFAQKIKAFFVAYWAKKKWTIPVTVLVSVLIIFATPTTRYIVLGLFMKQQATVTVVDSKTNTPVSGATVELGGVSLKTDGSGRATGKVRLGNTTLNITKQYYKAVSQGVMVTLSKNKNVFKSSLVAAGRQVPVKVVNVVTGKSLANAEIKVLNTSAKTNQDGTAIIVLPTTSSTQPATIQLDRYNTLKTTVQVTDQVVSANTFKLVPAGKLYFLSDRSGKVDVVKTDLDGSNRQIVVAGTGSEDPYDTTLIPSKDWKYLALVSRRVGANASLYLIDTSTDRLTTMDEGNARFMPVGWSNTSLVYVVSRNGYQNWQPGVTSLKSYNAQTGKLMTLDSTKAIGSSDYDAKYEVLFSNAVHLAGDTVVYNKVWYAYPGYLNVPGQQNTLSAVKADGSDKKVVASQDATTAYFGSLYQYSPNDLLVQVSYVSNSPSVYYMYKSDGTYSKYAGEQDISTLKDSFLNGTYPTFLLSPSGNMTFWSEKRDGKSVLFTGDSEGKKQKQIATLREYSPYGWFTDSYVLVIKDASELYIMPMAGSDAPLRIT